jgi:hypothetical protein
LPIAASPILAIPAIMAILAILAIIAISPAGLYFAWLYGDQLSDRRRGHSRRHFVRQLLPGIEGEILLPLR